MIKDNKIIFQLLLIVQLVGAPLFAADEELASETTLEQKLIEKNIEISNWFDSFAEGVDLFLVGKKVTSKRNESHINIENTTYSRESDNLVNVTSLSVNPRLPNLEAYWNLKFTTYDEHAVSPRTEKGYVRQTPREKNYGATIGLFRKLKDVRVAFQPRIELQDPLQVSHSLSFESVLDYQTYEVNPKFEFFANATKGTGLFQALNFHLKLSDVYSLTFLNEGEYEEKLHRYSVTNGVSLGQIISDISGFDYGLAFYSNNRPNYHLDGYSVSVAWSHTLYKRILDYQLVPHLDFTQEEHFRGFVGLVFKLRLHF